MNYKNYSNKAYNLHFITTDRFKSIAIKINFKKKIKKEDMTYRNLLTKVLLESTKKYNTPQKLEIKTEELYGLGINSSNYISGNYIITSFMAGFLSEEYTEKGMNNKSLQFILDIIFKPNITNGEFAYFDLAKRLVEDEINTFKDNIKSYATQKLIENMKLDNAYNPIGYIEDLNNISNKDLYNYYQNMLKSDLIDIFIIGNDVLKFKDLITNNFKINTIKKTGNSHFINHKKENKGKKIIETMPLEQAKLNIGFKLKKLTEFEKKYVMNIYTFILGGSPDSKLFKNVREKNSLCYNISCSNHPVSNIIIINAGINKEDFKKCLSLIKKELKCMSKGEFTDSEIEAAKKTYINSLKEIEDNQNAVIKIFESHAYLNFDLLDERSKNILKVTKKDIIKLSKKIKIDTIYLLEGEKKCKKSKSKN